MRCKNHTNTLEKNKKLELRKFFFFFLHPTTSSWRMLSLGMGILARNECNCTITIVITSEGHNKAIFMR